MRRDSALVELLHFLHRDDYRFTTLTPASHARILARPMDRRPDHRDIFGWNRPFAQDDLEPLLLGLLREADAVEDLSHDCLRSRVRVASLGDDLFLHSAFPTNDRDAVFFGPDTYRFVRFVQQQLPRVGQVRHLVDMGAGSGAGAIAALRQIGDARAKLVDVNATALRFAKANAAGAGLEVEVDQSSEVPPEADLLIANPPYMMDEAARSYRNGGDLLGGAVALDWVRQGLARRPDHRTILLYTGAPCVNGRFPLIAALAHECRAASAEMHCEEIDPDVFGEELSRRPYEDVERIAAIGLVISVGIAR